MSPRTLDHPGSAAGDVAASIGRHRRPESLADVPRPRLPRNEVPLREAGPNERRITVTAERPTRSARHQQQQYRQQVASHRAPSRPQAGSHRAPGTMPIESWLLMGRRRQQALLASLVAAGALLLAIPTEGQRNAVDAVDAAAQRALGGQATPRKPGNDKPTGDKGSARHTPTPSASAAATDAPPDVPPTSAAGKTMTGDGPSKSLLTTGSTAVALTFDDGPDPVQTPRILALLDKYQVKATFCLVGENVRRHPEIVRQIVEAGHTLCNHTWNHSLTIGKDKPADIRADLARTNAAIAAAAPGTAVPFFRAPGGNFSDRLVRVAAADGMTSLYWQVDPRDWDQPVSESDDAHVARVIADVKQHVRPGSIVLSHDYNQPDTIEAYAKLLPWLRGNFALGVPGEPAPEPSTPPSGAPAPSETPATPGPKPRGSASPETASNSQG